MRGNRTKKINSEGFNAFSSPNFPILAEAGINIKYNTKYIRYPESYNKSLIVNAELDTIL